MSLYRNPYLALMFMMILWRYLPDDDAREEYLKTMCEYDIKILCPECFQDTTNCNDIELFHPDWSKWSNRINSLIKRHSTQFGSFAGHRQLAVFKRLNRDNTIEHILNEFCKTRSFLVTHCSWTDGGSVDHAIAYLKKLILEESRIDGCIICPSSAKEIALQRFLNTAELTKNDLWKLLVIHTNVEPILLNLMSSRNGFFAVPKLLHIFGFSTIASYEGEPLTSFYNYPLAVRMMIARELIIAAINFTIGINGFRFLLTDLHSRNVVVRYDSNRKDIAIAIVDMDNVIIVDSLAEGIAENYNWHVHSQIECTGCFAYVQSDICRYRNSDVNLFATCQLLLEDMNGNSAIGMLHDDRSRISDDITSLEHHISAKLHNLLEECVYCRPPACRNRSSILDNILEVIDLNVEYL